MSETFRTTRAADGNFTILKNGFLQDALITSKARGIGSYVLSFPPDRHWTVDILAEQLLEGPDAIKKALKELEFRGYMHRSRTRKSNGTWQWDWLVADEIRFEPSVENPLMVSPAETQETPGHTIGGKSTSGKPSDKIFKESKPKIKPLKIKNTDRTNGSVGARETSDSGEDQIEVQEPKSASTRKQDPVGVAVSPSVDAGSGVEDRELKPWQMRDYWGNVVKNPEYVATEEDIRWMTNYYIERGFDADYAARFSRSQLMSPAQREAQQFLDSIDVELSVDEKREFYPLVTKLFGGSWQAGDLAQKLCWGLDGFGSPVAGFRKRLKGLVGGQVRAA